MQEYIRFDVEAPLVGWMAWKRVKAFLKPIHGDFHWTGPVMRGRVGVVKSDTIGIMAYESPRDMLDALRAKDKFIDTTNLVVGRVDLSGFVLKDKETFYAQRAAIQELWMICGDKHKRELLDIQHTLEWQYDCDVHVMSRSNLGPWAEYYHHTEP